MISEEILAIIPYLIQLLTDTDSLSNVYDTLMLHEIIIPNLIQNFI